MIQRVGIAQALVNDPDGDLSGRADVGARSARPPRRSARSSSSCATAARRCSSARTSCRTPNRSAAASRSSPVGGWPTIGRLQRHGQRCRFAAGKSWSRGRRARACSRRSAPGAISGHLGRGGPIRLRAAGRAARPKPLSRSSRRLARRCVSVNAAARDTLEDVFVQQVARSAGPIAARALMNVATLRRIALAVFRESVRDRRALQPGRLRAAA